MSTKTCTKCKLEKKLSEFHVDNRVKKTGLATWCKLCKLAYNRSLTQKDIPKSRRLRRKSYLKMHFGMSEEDWVSKRARGCGICGKTTGRFHVDHDHSCCPGAKTCGKCVRDVLCQSCNLGLGYIENGMLGSFLAYIDLWKKRYASQPLSPG